MPFASDHKPLEEGPRGTPPAKEGIEPGFVEARPTPAPAGRVSAGPPGDLVDAVLQAADGNERNALLMKASQGVSSDTIEEGMASMRDFKLREDSSVEPKVQHQMYTKHNRRFHPIINEAMETIKEGLCGRKERESEKPPVGYEDVVEKFMKEDRWTRLEYEEIAMAYGKTADHLQRLFDREFDKEWKMPVLLREARVLAEAERLFGTHGKNDRNAEEQLRKADPGLAEAEAIFSRNGKGDGIESMHRNAGIGKLADAERGFLYAIIRSRDSRSNRETNIFDAFAKGVAFLYLIQQRPGSYLHAIGHPEISKPYGKKLGGAEEAGITTGLMHYPKNLQYASLFRAYEDAPVPIIAYEMLEELKKDPNPPRWVIGKVEEMVRKDIAEFKNIVSNSGLSPEKFFEILDSCPTTESLKSSDEIREIAKKAAEESLIYNVENDVLDLLELINHYLFFFRMNPGAKEHFLKYYFANYPVEAGFGEFYKMFGMCLFDSMEELNNHPIARLAFEKDFNPTVRKCFAKRLETLGFEERQTLVADPGTPAASGGEMDFGDVLL